MAVAGKDGPRVRRGRGVSLFYFIFGFFYFFFRKGGKKINNNNKRHEKGKKKLKNKIETTKKRVLRGY